MKCCLRCDVRFEANDWCCPSCGHVPESVDGIPRFAPELEALDGDYDPSYHSRLIDLEEGHFWFEARNRIVLWAQRRYQPNPAKFLEVGCGTGFVLRHLHRHLGKTALVASDVHISGLRRARQRCGESIELLQMDARRIPYRDEFDAIGAFDVIEHIAEDETVLAELRAALKPGGILLLTVPQHAFLWSPADEAARHKRRYSRSELTGKLVAAGFEVMHATSFVFLLLPAMLLSRRRSRRQADYDPDAEFCIPRLLNILFATVMAVEFQLLRIGLSLPVGGSLLVVLRKSS